MLKIIFETLKALVLARSKQYRGFFHGSAGFCVGLFEPDVAWAPVSQGAPPPPVLRNSTICKYSQNFTIHKTRQSCFAKVQKLKNF